MRQRYPHWGTFLDEATRVLILIVAEQGKPSGAETPPVQRELPLRTAANQRVVKAHRVCSLSEGRKVHSTAPLKTMYYVAIKRFCPI